MLSCMSVNYCDVIILQAIMIVGVTIPSVIIISFFGTSIIKLVSCL